MTVIDNTVVVQNHEIRSFLVKQYGDRGRFCRSDRRNESLTIYSSALTPDILGKAVRSNENHRANCTRHRSFFLKAASSGQLNFHVQFCITTASLLLRPIHSNNFKNCTRLRLRRSQKLLSNNRCTWQWVCDNFYTVRTVERSRRSDPDFGRYSCINFTKACYVSSSNTISRLQHCVRST